MRTLVVGHSFVKRFARHLLQSSAGRSRDYARVLGLPREDIYVEGRGGLKIRDFDFISNAVVRHRPDVVVIEIGTNDICEARTSDQVNRLADTLVSSAEAFPPHVKSVILCLVVGRRRNRRNTVVSQQFEEWRQQYNQRLRTLVANSQRLKVYKHDRSILVNLRTDITNDEIHITSRRGLELYTFSMRKAIRIGLRMASSE